MFRRDYREPFVVPEEVQMLEARTLQKTEMPSVGDARRQRSSAGATKLTQ